MIVIVFEPGSNPMNDDEEELMSDDEYTNVEGMECPRCHSGDVEGTHIFNIDGMKVCQEVKCLDCQFVWDNVYELIGWAKKLEPK
jgi:hypothetical protein